jgi:hypothetical protein
MRQRDLFESDVALIRRLPRIKSGIGAALSRKRRAEERAGAKVAE